MTVDTINLNQIAPNRGVASTNYFNGRTLAAEDLTADQAARRQQIAQVGRAVGAGVAYGLQVYQAPVPPGSSGPFDERDGRLRPGGQPPGPAAGAAGGYPGGAQRHDAAGALRLRALRRLPAASIVGHRRELGRVHPHDQSDVRLRGGRALG